MRRSFRRSRRCLLGLGLMLAILGGCQTWVGEITLPTPQYTEHPPALSSPTNSANRTTASPGTQEDTTSGTSGLAQVAADSLSAVADLLELGVRCRVDLISPDELPPTEPKASQAKETSSASKSVQVKMS